jgi:hypothetical protein
MGLLARAKKIDRRLSDSERLYRVKQLLDTILPPVILILLLVVYLELIVGYQAQDHAWLLWTERSLLAYFVLEILVDFLLYTDNRKFLRHKWLDIVLVIPLLNSLKAAGKVLKAVKVMKPAKGVKGAKAAKGVKAGKLPKAVKGGRKTAKAVKKMKETLKD